MLNNEHISSAVLIGYEHGQTTIVYCMVLVCLACSTFVRARVPVSAIYVCNFELVNIVCFVTSTVSTYIAGSITVRKLNNIVVLSQTV